MITKKQLLVATAFVSFSLAPSVYAADTTTTASPPAPAATAATALNPVVARLVAMHLARLAMQQLTAIETADQIVGDSKIYAGSYGDVERKQLRTNSNLIAESYIDFVDYQADNATTWPPEHTKEAAKAELATLKQELKKPDAEALPILKRANEVFAWTAGKPGITPDIDHFARVDTLVAYAIAHVPDAAKLSDPAPAVAATTEQPPPLPPPTTTTTATTSTTGTGLDATTTPPPLPTNPADALMGTAKDDTTTQTALTTTPTTETTTTTTTTTDTPTVAPLTTIAARLATIHLIRAAIGEENPAQLEETVGTELKTYAAANPPDGTKVRDDLKATATRYVDLVADAAKSATKWPEDKPAATYVGMAALALEMARNEITDLNDDTSDLTGPLRRVNRVLAWTTGAAETPPAMDHFAKHQALVEAALGKAVAVEQPQRPQ